MKRIVVVLLIALVVLHQDFWWRNDKSLVLGFLPISFAWHIGLSVLATVVWGLTCRYAWPADVDSPDDGPAAMGGHH